jgi:hypothetical protein
MAIKKKPLTPKEKLDALPPMEKLALIRGIQANDERTLQYYYRNFVDPSTLRKGKSMDQFHYMLARKECEAVDGMGGNSDFDKYIFDKSFQQASLA